MSYKNENVPEELNTALLENPGGCKKKKMQFFKHKAKCLKLCFARSPGSDGVRAAGAGAAPTLRTGNTAPAQSLRTCTLRAGHGPRARQRGLTSNLLSGRLQNADRSAETALHTLSGQLCPRDVGEEGCSELRPAAAPLAAVPTTSPRLEVLITQ